MEKVHETDFAHVECPFIIDLYGEMLSHEEKVLISAKRLDITLSHGYCSPKRRQGTPT